MKMKPKHTPGPWSFCERSQTISAHPDDPRSIVDMKHWERSCAGTKTEQDANARLIAAAPEMYAALLEAGMALKGMLGGTCLSSVLEAIAKARGDD